VPIKLVKPRHFLWKGIYQARKVSDYVHNICVLGISNMPLFQRFSVIFWNCSDSVMSPLKLCVRAPFMARCTRYNRSAVFSVYSCFLHQLTATIYWNIVESGVKHHNPNLNQYIKSVLPPGQTDSILFLWHLLDMDISCCVWHAPSRDYLIYPNFLTLIHTENIAQYLLCLNKNKKMCIEYCTRIFWT
jgi:hypothetical protein